MKLTFDFTVVCYAETCRLSQQMDTNFPQQESPLVGTSCDIIYQDKIEANINMAYGSSTVSCSPFFLLQTVLPSPLSS